MVKLIDIARTPSDAHRVFLSIVVDNRAIMMREVVYVWTKCVQAYNIYFDDDPQVNEDDIINTIIETINNELSIEGLSRLERKFTEQFYDEEFIVLANNVLPSFKSLKRYVAKDEQIILEKLLNLMFVNPENRGELRYVRYIDAVTSDKACKSDSSRAEQVFKSFVAKGMFNHIDRFDTYIFSIHFSTEITPRVKQYDVPECWVCNRLIFVKRFSTKCVDCRKDAHNTCLFRLINVNHAGALNAAIRCRGKRKCAYKYTQADSNVLVFDTLQDNDPDDYGDLPTPSGL